MHNDMISRNRLKVSMMREGGILIDGQRYLRADAVMEKIRIAPAVEAIADAEEEYLRVEREAIQKEAEY
jgi:hypothetical protein